MSFKCGTYKGMDLTFGCKQKNIFGGILIRSIMDLKDGKYIEGPCNSVSKLLEHREAKEFKDLKLSSWPDHDGCAFDTSSPWYLEYCDLNKTYPWTAPKIEIMKSCRVGLTLKRYD